MESELYVKDRDVVVPGMVLAKGMDYLPSKGTYRKDETILANRLGLVQLDGKVIKTLPLAGRYIPKKDDIVIGRVTDVLLTGWRIEINSPYESVLTMKDASSEFIQRGADLTRYFSLQDWVICQIVQVTSQNLIDVSMRGPGLRKLIGGTIMNVNAQKVPRIIGKRGSMVGMIKRATDCNILVGQNGRVWLNGTPEMEVVAIEAIKMIEANAHRSGLTDRVKEYLREKTGRTVDATEDTSDFQDSGQQGESGGYQRKEFNRDGPRREGIRNFRGGNFRREGFRPNDRPPRPPRDGAPQHTDTQSTTGASEDQQ
jgi:exosome complex component RRP4